MSGWEMLEAQISCDCLLQCSDKIQFLPQEIADPRLLMVHPELEGCLKTAAQLPAT